MRAALLAVLLLASPAFADGPHHEGDYGGVQPGETHAPEGGPGGAHGKRHKPRKGTLSWIGFEAKEGGAEVFFQSVAPFQVDQRVEKGTLVVHLSGLRRLGHNVGRPIDTHFFDNPLALIKARRGGRHGGIDVRITFKDPKTAGQASLRTATEADGMFYAYLSFAAPAPSSAGTVDEPEK